jgi:rubrerythrin
MSEQVEFKTLEDVLTTAAKFEKAASDFYKMLGGRFSHIPGLAAFFDDLVKDELKHEQMILSVKNSLPKEKLAGIPPEDLKTSMFSIQKLIKMITEYDIQNLDDAYELAHQLEFSEVNSVLKLIITKLVTTERYDEFVATRIDEHEEKLLEFDRLFGDKAWRKQQKFHAGG